MSSTEALELLGAAPYVQLAGTGADGRPILRVVHAVIVDGSLAFHAAPAGEKLELLGRAVIAGTEEIIAEVPSWIRDPERACPATTFYRSAQVHGRLEPIDDPSTRARVLAELMRRFQPEGRHVPIDPAHPQWDRLYRKVVAGLLLARIVPERITGKHKLGQTMRAEQLAAVLDGLWRRGARGGWPVDRALEICRAAHPARPLPAFLRGPEGFELCARPRDDDLATLVPLLCAQYWNERHDPGTIAAAHRASPAWVGARDREGRLVASARATGDGAKRGMIFDVVVEPEHRGKGLGAAVMRLLLDHVELRGCRHLELLTRDAQPFYRRLGFVDMPDRHTRMALDVAG
jgi:GNAT superfamily N-acetyltransferase/nitroimidazol reductase NimA-like FMN-containing flavoprotein (pyridoxamine 5'-phosphate oxidase superfamily)